MEGAGGFGVDDPLNWLKTKTNGELVQRQSVKKKGSEGEMRFCYLATPEDPALGLLLPIARDVKNER